ncbi:MAG TPA: hypothetical protein VFR18_15995 [Terriglobia bacterium]|nr:hypothetical protein [Terriglobia bacterium]
MKGSTLRDVFPAAPMATFLATHAVSLDDLREEAWSELRQLKDDFVVIDGERRATYLVEATLKNNGISMDAPPGRLPDVDYAHQSANPFAYFAAPGAPPAKVRYWIDKQHYLVLRRTGIQTEAKIVATAQRTTTPNSPSAIPNSEVVLRTEDLFSRVDLGAAVPESVFTFRAMDGAREIPNLRQPAPTPPDGDRQVFRTADVWAYYRVLPDALNLTVEVPQGWSAAITVDVDQDGKRAQPDVEYGKTGDLICSSRVLDATKVSSCGGFESKALLRLQRTGQREVLNFVLPRRELSAYGTALFPHEVIFPTN